MSRQLSLFKYLPTRRVHEESGSSSSNTEGILSTLEAEESEPQRRDDEQVQAEEAENQLPTSCQLVGTASVDQGDEVDDVGLTHSSAPCQPRNITFPKRAYSDKVSRSFNPGWFHQYSWLEYSIKKDAAFCFPCRQFGISSIGRGRPEKAFTVHGFRDWKHATGNKGSLIAHNNSFSHKQSVVAWEQYRATSSSGTVVEQLGSNRSEMIKKNRHYFQAICDLILTCCRQDIALRGHRETNESSNRGNFLEFLLLISRYDPIVDDRLRRGPGNALYISHNIQNTIINIMASLVRRTICTSIQKAGYFSLLVDETKDLSKNEQMSFCLRFIDPDSCEIVERFLTFVSAPCLTAEHLSQYIVDTLAQHCINLSSMVSQGYDGAAVMSGSVSGVQKRIRDLVPHAVYIHCHAHCLNLVLVDCVKSLPQASEFFSLIQSLYVFMSASKAHVIYVQQQHQLHPEKQPRELQRLSDTRWACRYASLDSICSTFDCILSTLEVIGDSNDKAKAIEAVGLYHHIHNFPFLSCLVIFTRIMGMTKLLSDQLQSSSLDLASATDLVVSTIQSLKELRSDNKWSGTFKYITDVATKYSIEVESDTGQGRGGRGRSKRRRQSALSEDYIVDSTIGQRDSLNTSERLKVDIYFPVIDSMLSEMERRFSSIHLGIMKAIQACTPTSSHFLEVTELREMALFYGLKDDQLATECQLAVSTLSGKNLSSSMEVYQHILKLQTAFPTLTKLLQIALTLAVSSAQCERSFSALKRIKTYLRTTMTDQRLSDVSILSIERDLSGKICFNEVMEQFEGGESNRSIVLS